MLYKKYLKRIIDFTLSLGVLILLNPLLIFLAVVIRIKLGKPVIFKQKRIGLNERIFTMYKFRTMTEERNMDNILLSDDMRLNKFGKFLRSYSLDELPELWNIISGDMGLVGPRPLLLQYLPLYNSEQKHRHDVRPGLTGLAQINGRNTISWQDKFSLDIKYVNSYTFLMDLKIVLLTIKKVLIREGINSEYSATMEKFKGNSMEAGKSNKKNRIKV